VITFSASTGRGGKEVWQAIESALADFNNPALV
jgi:hypothetical protein